MSQELKNNINLVLCLSFLYIVLLVLYGYTYGHGNGIQLIPYAMYLNDNSLFSNDFFVQSAREHFPNERSFFIYLIKPFGKHIEWAVFIQHCIFSITLLYTLYKIAFHLLKNTYLSFSALIILLIPLNYYSIGLVELYSIEFTSNLVADTFSALAILYMLKEKYNYMYLFLILSTLMHPLAGFQTFLLVTATLCIWFILQKNSKVILNRIIPYILIYMLSAGWYVFVLQNKFNDITIGNEELFQTFFTFRNAHHYIPSYFSKISLILLTPLYLLTPFLIFRYDKKLFIFSVLIVLGCILYTVGVETHSVFIAQSQWFKTTIWLKFFAIIGILLLLVVFLPKMKTLTYSRSFIFFAIVFSMSYVFFEFPQISGIKNNIAYEFPFYKKITPEIDISLQASQKTPIDALFIQPCSFDELKTYGKRSSYLDYKAIVHKQSYLREWTARFNEVYSIDAERSSIVSFNVLPIADENFNKISLQKIENLKVEAGISHIIMQNNRTLPYAIVASNLEYTIYKL